MNGLLPEQQQLEILSEALEMATALIFVTDGVPPSRGGPHILWANRAFLNEMGYQLEEIVGCTPAFFYGPNTDRASAKRLRDAIEAGNEGSAEYIVYRKNGTPVWVDFSGRLIRSSADKQDRWIAVGRNVDKQRTAQENLEEFVHNVKSPITAIVGFAQMLADPQADRHDREIALETIQSTAQRLAKLATDTLTMSKLERDEMSLSISSFDISQLIDEIIQVHSRQRQISFITKGTLKIDADKERLRQAIDNVVINAIHYSSAPIAITLYGTETACRIAVQDRGIGIPPSDVATVFQRFTRGSNVHSSSAGGSGLGLYLVKTIVEQHGGHIDIQSQENIGTTVTLTIPTSHGQQ